MNNRKKSGFTIVELIIVIAVIGVLAAILIPAFQGMIKKAHMADDKTMAKNFNTALVTAQISENVFPASMAEVVAVLESAGYRGEQLNAKADGCSFIWDSTTNQIMYGEINTAVSTKGAPAQSPITIYYSLNSEYSTTTADWYIAISKTEDINGAVDCTYFLLDSATIENTIQISSPCGIGVMMGKKLIVNDGAKIIFNTEKAGTIKLDGVIYGEVEINASECNVVQSGAVKKLIIAAIKNDGKSEIKGYAKELVVIDGKVIIQHNAYIQSFGNNSNSISDNNGYIDTYTAEDANNINNLGFVHQTSFNMPAGFNPVLEMVYNINHVTELYLLREMV
ncbi:MAG: prepilin-type N-terminal cleavage/methylation domain-containing protein, partial [Clostridiales bacterium]|nr:prepilin-type N-terminal cleavage/methylation domain-containing protein [Clostridiales bacterium]